jgi:hypothetical protein
MSVIHRVLTVHVDTSVPVQLAILDAVEEALHGQRASRVWIDSGMRPDLLVLAEFDD